MVSEPLTRMTAAEAGWQRPSARTAATAAPPKRAWLSIIFSVSVLLLFSEDRLDQIPDMGVDVLKRLFVGGPNLLGCSLHEGRVSDVPVEPHRLGRRRGENFLGLVRQGDDDLVVIDVGDLADGFG